MKKLILILAAILLAVVIIVCVCLTAPWFEYVREKPSNTFTSNVSSTVSSETGSQSEPSIESVLGNYTEFLIEEYYDSRFNTFIAVKDINGDGVDELLMRHDISSYIDVYTFRNGAVVRLGHLTKVEGIGSVYYCENYPGISYVTPSNNICYYTTIKDNLLVEEQIWYGPVDVFEDTNLVQETRYAYDNNKYINFEALASFPEIQQSAPKPWYLQVSPRFPSWALNVAGTRHEIYYVAEDGVYSGSANFKKIVDEKSVGGLWLDDQIGLYYNTATEIKCYLFSNLQSTRIWDTSKIPIDAAFEFNKKQINDFRIHGDYLYVQDNNLVCIRVNLKTGDVQKFLDGYIDCVFDDKYAYYIAHDKSFSIYSIHLETLETNLVSGEDKFKPQNKILSRVYTANGELYYYDRATQAIYLHNNGVNDTLVVRTPAENVYCQDNKLYCFVENEDGKYVMYDYSNPTSPQQTNVVETELSDGWYVVLKKCVVCFPNFDSFIDTYVYWY